MYTLRQIYITTLEKVEKYIIYNFYIMKTRYIKYKA